MSKRVRATLKYKGDGGPLLACFPSGPPPPSAFETDGSGLAWVVDDTESQPSRKRRTLTASNDDMTYSGRDYRAPYLMQTAKFLTGLYDPQDNTLTLYNGGHVYAMHAHSASGARALVDSDEEGSEEAVDHERDAARQRRSMLIQDFGSRLKQRAQASKAANMISDDMIAASGAVVSQLAAEGRSLHALKGGKDLAAAVEEADMKARSQKLPGFNPHATDVQNVYPFDAVMPAAVGRALTEDVATLRKASKKPSTIPALAASGVWPAYVIACLNRGLGKLSDAGDTKNADKRAARLLALLSYMLVLYKAGSRLRRYSPPKPKDDAAGAGAGAPPPPSSNSPVACLADIPRDVAKFLLNTFVSVTKEPGSSAKTYNVTPLMRDKLICHICCVALWAEGFQLNILSLASSMAMTPMQLLKYFREVGCTFKAVDGGKKKGKVTKTASYVVTLALPLVFPQPRKGNKSRR